MKSISKLSDLVFYKMEDYNQITIDLVQEAEDMLVADSVSEEKVGALQYTISTVLDVINPVLTHDIKALTELHESLNSWL